MSDKNKFPNSISVLEEIILNSDLDLPYVFYHISHKDPEQSNKLVDATADLYFSDLSSLKDIKSTAADLKNEIKMQVSLSDNILSYYFKIIDKAAENRLLALYRNAPA